MMICRRLTIVLIVAIIHSILGQRVCELQGSCFRCEHDRYSFYACGSDADCFPEEYCNAQQFCCPLVYSALAPPVAAFGSDYNRNVAPSADLGEASFELHFRPISSSPAAATDRPSATLAEHSPSTSTDCSPLVLTDRPLITSTNRSPTTSTDRLSAASLSYATILSRCPDGISEWQRMCKADSDCIFRDEICAYGKCCPSCEQRRAQTLRQLRGYVMHKPNRNETFGTTQSSNLSRSKFNDELERGELASSEEPEIDDAWGGVFIPQCVGDDGRFYRAMQCANGTNDCFCVTRYGRRLRTGDLSDGAPVIDCNHERYKYESTLADKHVNNAAHHQHANADNSTAALIASLKDDLRRRAALEGDVWEVADAEDDVRENAATADLLEIGDGSLKNSFAHTHITSRTYEKEDSVVGLNNPPCADPLREWKLCGSTCPISCATQTRIACVEDQCRRGCFCRLPYVIRHADDPWNSRCVLPSECPLLPYTLGASDNDALHTFFRPAPRLGANHDADDDSAIRPIVPVNRCADPLKNFLTCGSACPRCGRLSADCEARCVVGCFCRVPYVLRNAADVASPCILPQHCPAGTHHRETECNQRPNRQWNFCASKTRCTRSCAHLASLALSTSSTTSRHLQAACGDDECRAGCDCEPPYVWLEVAVDGDDASECVLPSDCPPMLRAFSAGDSVDDASPTWSTMPREFFTPTSSTALSPTATSSPDIENETSTSSINSHAVEAERCALLPNKVFRACASSCPLACDNHNSRWCTPCVSGCFCRNGFVFENSSNWRESACVRASQCPQSSSSNPVTSALPRNGIFSTLMTKPQERTTTDETKLVMLQNECPRETSDRNGRACDRDFECGFQQKCCGVTSRKTCTCIDPNAVWLECGTVCSEYCRLSDTNEEKDARGACPKICRPGCYCASGFIKRTADSSSECVSVAKCLTWRAADAIQAHHARYSNSHDHDSSISDDEIDLRSMTVLPWSVKSTTLPSLLAALTSAAVSETYGTNGEDACSEALASGVLYAPGGSRIGRIVARPERRAAGIDEVNRVDAGVYRDRLMRIGGELRLDALRSKELSSTAGAVVYLAIHQFSDTTVNGCRGIGAPLLLRLVDEDKNGFVVTTATTNIFVGRLPLVDDALGVSLMPRDAAVVEQVEKVFAWQEQIVRGTNPLIGHSIVLKAFPAARRATIDGVETHLERTTIATLGVADRSVDGEEQPFACAILGIVPSC